jgi:queuine tRNA-ribosyltransferase
MSTSAPRSAAPRPGEFTIEATQGQARASRLVTAHGEIAMPAFFPVATRAAVKMLTMQQTADQGVPGLLMNSFHLHLRPGERVVAELGGLHEFSGWHRPIVTDSGGFQVFSLPALRTVSDDGVVFASPIDGSVHEFTPEGVVAIQRALGADVIVSLDECVQYPAPAEAIHAAATRTIAWNRRCAAAWREGGPGTQLLFGIVQGGMIRELRLESVARLAELELPGYAVGGVSVGEGPALAREVLSYTLCALPGDRPRYVMGVGRPEDLLDYVAMGADMFDCVLPTRNARGACAFTRSGKVRLRNAVHALSDEPIERGCDCACCASVSRGYLRHLYLVGEAAASTLVSLHNVRFFTRLMDEARASILAGTFPEYRESFQETYRRGESGAQN